MKTAPICQRSDVIDGIPFFTLTILFRKNCYEALGGMDEDPRLSSLEDAEYFARLVTQFQIHRQREILAHYRMSSLENPSLGLSTVTADNATGWILTEVYERKGILTPDELKRRKAFLHYQQARTNHFLFGEPFRRSLWKCMLTGSPPWQAMLMLGLSFLPGPVLAALLSQGQRWINTSKQRRAKDGSP